jgi:uncharacterized phage protein (TIGR02218 family)
MSIHTSEQKTQQGVVYETYHFKTPFNDYYYTSYFDTKDIAGDAVYRAENIERSGIEFSVDFRPQELAVSLPLANTMVSTLKFNLDLPTMSLTAYKVFSEDTTQKEQIFGGDLVEVTFSGGRCLLRFRDISRLFERSVAKITLKSTCNNQFCDDICGLDPLDYQHNAIVTVSEAGKKLNSAEFLAIANVNKNLEAGVCHFPGAVGENAYRHITTHAGGDITIQRSFKSLQNGDQVIVWEGCKKHPLIDCKNHFWNISQFVGMPYVPLKDCYTEPVVGDAS